MLRRALLMPNTAWSFLPSECVISGDGAMPNLLRANSHYPYRGLVETHVETR